MENSTAFVAEDFAPAAAELPPPLVRVDNLSIDLPSGDHWLRIIDGISFSIRPGERVALVGESGSGKSVTARALMRLDKRARIAGRIEFDGRNLLSLSEPEMARYRGAALGMVFQDPMSSLDPLMKIGDQVAETLVIQGISKKEARARAIGLLEELGVDRARERAHTYPHEFSGGMRQRVVLAMALIGDPQLLIADEPTTALDVRVQEQVLELIDEVSRRRNLAALLITHNLGIVAGFADRVIVMYAGRIVEDGPVAEIFANPAHPYTRGLLAAVPRADVDIDYLVAVPGAPPTPRERPAGCAFHPRCVEQIDRCASEVPALATRFERRLACHVNHIPIRAG